MQKKTHEHNQINKHSYDIVFNARFIPDNLNCFEIDTGICCKIQYTENMKTIILFRCGYDIFIFLFIILNLFTFIYGKFYFKFAAVCGAVVLANHGFMIRTSKHK